MSENLDELSQAYRKVKAPPYLATRIAAEVSERSYKPQRWMPAGATIVAVIAVLWLVPESESPPAANAIPKKPSLAALATLKPAKPTGTTVSLTQIRTVKRPSLPTKPQLRSTKPQTRLEQESDLLKENDHVHS